MTRSVVVHHLEMTSPDELRPARPAREELHIVRPAIPCPELNRFFYTAVGGDWFWIDRLSWPHERWSQWVARPEVETWVAYSGGNPVGYFELEAQPQDDVEIAYFGLLPQFAGKGFGGAMLTTAVRRAWELPVLRVWVHTCSLDHPAALANYIARGFRKFKEETIAADLPERTPGPWPGARTA